jgi:hypothetical protein
MPVGSHPYASTAISGNLVFRSLNPANTFRPEQMGHPACNNARLLTCASQICPKLHFQVLFWCEPTLRDVGSHPYASFATSGNLVFRSLNPANTFRPEQMGHPVS